MFAKSITTFFNPVLEKTPTLTISTSEQSESLSIVRFQNNALNLFFRNSELGNFSKKYMLSVEHACLELTNGYYDNINHPTWHSSKTEFYLRHNHIIRKDHKALSPQNVHCTLNYLKDLSDHINTTTLEKGDMQNIEYQYHRIFPQVKASSMNISEETFDGLMLPFAYLMYECLNILAYKYLKPYLLAQGLDARTTKNVLRLFANLLVLLMVLDIPILVRHLLLMDSISMLMEQFMSYQLAQSLSNIVGTISTMFMKDTPLLQVCTLMAISMLMVVRIRMSFEDNKFPSVSEIPTHEISPEDGIENPASDKKIR